MSWMLSKWIEGHACSHRRKSSTESSIPDLKASSESIMDKGSRFKSSYFTLKSRASLKLIPGFGTFWANGRHYCQSSSRIVSFKAIFSNTLQYFQRRALPGFQMLEGFFWYSSINRGEFELSVRTKSMHAMLPLVATLSDSASASNSQWNYILW